MSVAADCPRTQHEAFEEAYFAPAATRSVTARRDREEAPCELRTAFQRDRDRILHSKALRRLKHKTQVFLAPEGDHYRTRMTHTLEVAQISRTVARALKLNEDLVEAIALGHDLGHTPFGHAGERVLDALYADGFEHNVQSVRVVEVLEPMNLSVEVRDGILNHRGVGVPFTLEGQVVKICDRVAYLNHDIDDALRAGLLHEADLPPWVEATFGKSKGDRIHSMVLDLVNTTRQDYGHVRMSDAFQEPFLELRAFMFQEVYYGSSAKVEEAKVQGIIEGLYRFYAATQPERAVVDFVAGMTDRYAIQDYERIFMPRPWRLRDEGPR
ncbi:MAG: dgt [Cyanobacteria bacterium RYN_339]|nr:dgt [Cyanobacteria bacterium RYN_339]